MLLDDLSLYLTPELPYPVQNGFLQELPNEVVALRETGGFPSPHVLTSEPGLAVLDQPTVQVVTRARDYVTAMLTARQAHALLDGLRERELNGVLYQFIKAMQPPFFLSRDENNRFLCAFNIHIQRRVPGLVA